MNIDFSANSVTEVILLQTEGEKQRYRSAKQELSVTVTLNFSRMLTVEALDDKVSFWHKIQASVGSLCYVLRVRKHPTKAV